MLEFYKLPDETEQFSCELHQWCIPEGNQCWISENLSPSIYPTKSSPRATIRRINILWLRQTDNNAVPQSTARQNSPHFLPVFEVANAFLTHRTTPFMCVSWCDSSHVSLCTSRAFAFLPFEFPLRSAGDFVCSPGGSRSGTIPIHSLSLVFPHTFTFDPRYAFPIHPVNAQ